MKLISFLCIFLVVSCHNKVVGQDIEGFALWKEGLREKALKQGYEAQFLDKVFAQISFTEKHVAEDKKQFRKKSFSEYYNNAINDLRIRKAKRRLKKYNQILTEVDKKYLVPKEYIVALWGIESDFGSRMGNFNVLNSLANLSYEGRRRDFFETEFFIALEIIKNNKIKPSKFKGSWAGAIGQSQFMPSTYKNYAVDFNGNGQTDIWREKHDIFASIANYLASYRWNSTLPWGYEAVFTEDFVVLETDKKYKLEKLKKWGLKKIDGTSFSKEELKEWVKIYQYDERLFVTFKNYDILKRWNNSNYFALTIGLFSDEVKL